MKRNLRQEFRTSMDSLRFSDKTKEEMVMKLMNKTNPKPRSGNKRKTLVLILAAAIALVTFTGAGVYTRWSRTAQHRYTPSEEIKTQAEDSGLSELLEEKKELSVTDQGITVTAVQSLVDEHGGELIFRVEGFKVPEDRYPAATYTMTIDGDEHFFVGQEWNFSDGTTTNEKGEWVYAASGKPVEFDENDPYHSAILQPVAPDGSLEFNIRFSKQPDFGNLSGKEVSVTFTGFGVQSSEKAGMPEMLVDGNWTLTWNLSATSNELSIKPNAEIGNSGVTLLEAIIGQRTIETTYQLSKYWNGLNRLETLPQGLCGVRMKNGTEYLCYPTQAGYSDEKNLIYHEITTMQTTILDIQQVESLMFHNPIAEDATSYIYIPVQ